MTSLANQGGWSVIQREFELRLSYADGGGRAQFGALHLDSSYLRLVPSRDSGWGTSIVLLPALWSHGQLIQGSGVAVYWTVAGERLRLAGRGRIGLLVVDLEVEVSPPADGRLSARVNARVGGKMHLDRREGEAFRLVTLSSMRVSERLWDAKAAYADDHRAALGRSGRIFGASASVLAKQLGLVGGTSEWKPNAPSVEIDLDRRRRVGGWLTPGRDPSGDNVSLWVATSTIARAWSYTIHVRQPD